MTVAVSFDCKHNDEDSFPPVAWLIADVTEHWNNFGFKPIEKKY